MMTTASAGGGFALGDRDVDVTNTGGFIVDDKVEEELHGDFAAGERTKRLTPEDEQSALVEGDFASGERTEPLTEEEQLEANMHGDFARGERKEPLTPESVEEGSYASEEK